MKNLAEIEEKLEALRTRLNEEVNKSMEGENTSEKILKLSQEVDLLVLEYQKLLNQN